MAGNCKEAILPGKGLCQAVGFANNDKGGTFPVCIISGFRPCTENTDFCPERNPDGLTASLEDRVQQGKFICSITGPVYH